MTRSTLLARCTAAAAAATLLAGFAATAASARPDPGERSSTGVNSDGTNCPLNRLDTQLVRCDNLTGAGAPAAAWIPEF
jgi:hypothetical protein